MSWQEATVLVTGGGGFLGKHVVAQLAERGCRRCVAPRRAEYDLTRPGDAARLLRDTRPDVVIHLAAVVGGIGANQANPGRFFYDNLVMGASLIEQARLQGVGKFVAVGTVCSYPKFTPVPFREEDLWAGYPEETNAPYGIAKKALLVQLQAYREQYGFRGIYLIPTNLYGPGDHCDPASSHVIPAVIRKCCEAVRNGSPEIVLWGDGTPTRDFLYAEDAAEGIALATESYEDAAPVNLGSGQEVSIREIAERIAALTGFRGRVAWDTSRPNGQPRRCVDSSRAEKAFGFTARTPIDEGLRRTVEWYRAHQ
jgi:GDP-L-fucose synthase